MSAESTVNLAQKENKDVNTPAAAAPSTDNDFRKNFNYPLFTEMGEEMKTEAVDLVVTCVEKYAANFEAGAKAIKDVLDRKFGTSWHVVVGEGFSFEITHEMRNILFMYFGGNLGILLWKAT